ncbi:hypothetical protein D9M72_450340 [compost metagenome]
MPEFPSTLILPPLCENTEPYDVAMFPLTFTVPAVTLKTPRIFKELLLSVQPTTKSPPETDRVPPNDTVRFLHTFAAEFTVIVCPEAMLTASVQFGTFPLLQIEALFQFPLAIEKLGVSAKETPKYKGAWVS